MNNTIKIGILGLGTVGSGVVKSLANFPEIKIEKISVRNLEKQEEKTEPVAEAKVEEKVEVKEEPIVKPKRTRTKKQTESEVEHA